MEEYVIGEVKKFYSNIGVVVIKLSDNLVKGTNIHFRGFSTDFEEIVDSMEVNGKSCVDAKKDDEVGIKVSKSPKIGDFVFKIIE